jgi:UDP-N-acetylmuramate dehydrogenase
MSFTFWLKMCVQMAYWQTMSLPRFERNVPLSDHTTFRIGGPAAAFIEVASQDGVIEAAWKAEGMGLPWHVIGHGSNILASDKGYDGAIIVFKDLHPPTLHDDGNITVSGGFPLFDLVRFMAERGLTGIEDLAGIPGTVGGAIAGNAGAYGKSISDALASLLLLDRNGGMRRVSPAELFFAYRTSSLKGTGDVVLEATFRTSPADAHELMGIVEARLTDRRQKHPDHALIPTAGSFFKNPTNGDGSRIPAGKLLDDAGCKDLRVGGARLWHKHANIIVAESGTKASEVKELAEQMSQRVSEHHGIALVPEVVYLA